MVAVVMAALVSMLVTRPGIAPTIKRIGDYLASAIRATLGT